MRRTRVTKSGAQQYGEPHSPKSGGRAHGPLEVYAYDHSKCGKKYCPKIICCFLSNHLECLREILCLRDYVHLNAKWYLIILIIIIVKYNEVIDILASLLSDFCALKNVCAETPRNSATETTMFSF